MPGGAIPSRKQSARDGGERRRQGLDDRIVAALEGRADDRDRQRRSRERQQAHPAARDARLAAARPPETNGDDDREQRPVDEEEDDVRREPPRPRLARGREARQRERPDREHDRHRRDEPLQALGRRREDGREAVEEVREENEQLDRDALRDVLEQAVRMGGHEAPDRDDQSERQEREREPARRVIAATAPLQKRHEGEGHIDDRVDDAERQ